MLRFNQASGRFWINLSKSALFITLAANLVSCNNTDSNNESINQPSMISSFATTISDAIEGDERDIEAKKSPTNKLKLINLPQLPTLPVYAVFNNDYKGLYTDNEIIAHADPKNTDKYFFSLINSAKTSIDASVFDIDDPDATNAFIEAEKRGVTVRIVTDGDNLKDKVDPTLPRSAIENLKAAGIPVHDDGSRSPFMHNKFIIVDNKIVWTGSYNLSTNAMYRDNNNVVMVNSPELAANYNAEFSRLFEQGLFNQNPHEIPNPIVNINGTTIKTYFSPGGGTKQAITEILNNAKKSIKFMAFSFNDADMAAILEAKIKTPGFQVDGVVDQCEISKYSVYSSLKQNKVSVRGDGNQALMHHKTMIIDDSIVITGSFNFSKNAELNNNENTLIINSPTLAKVYNSEFSRIKYASMHNTNLPPYDHPACKH